MIITICRTNKCNQFALSRHRICDEGGWAVTEVVKQNASMQILAGDLHDSARE